MHAADAPRGSFAISGHDAPHVHMALADPHNRFVLATDLGQDRIYVYRFDQQTGKLAENAPSTALPSGDGPRHFAFRPNGRWLYSIQEESRSSTTMRKPARSAPGRPSLRCRRVLPGPILLRRSW
jgi:6-phosphogluconolactonase (cycloisomerase 2 family)